jgi:hypothetical protein
MCSFAPVDDSLAPVDRFFGVLDGRGTRGRVNAGWLLNWQFL